MLRLKTADELDWQDLPHIESPFFARYAFSFHIETDSNLRSQLRAFYADQKGELTSDLAHLANDTILDEVMQLIGEGSLFYLVEHFTTPFRPLVRWIEDDSQPEGGRWTVTESNPALEIHITMLLAKDRYFRRREMEALKPTPIISHAGMTPVERQRALQLDEAAWSKTRVPVGQSVHAGFLALNAQGGESATITLFETNADGSQTEVDTLNVALETGTKRYKIEWSRSEEEAEEDLAQDEEENDTGPVGYTFEVVIGNAMAKCTKALNLVHTVHITTKRNDDEQLPDGADIILIAADGKRHQGQINEGILEYQYVVVGPFHLELSHEG